MSSRWSGRRGSNAFTVLVTVSWYSLSFAACFAISSSQAGPGVYLDVFPGAGELKPSRNPSQNVASFTQIVHFSVCFNERQGHQSGFFRIVFGQEELVNG